MKTQHDHYDRLSVRLSPLFRWPNSVNHYSIELTVSEEETFFIAHENGVWFDCHNVDEEGEPLPLPSFFKSLVDTLMHDADTVSKT
ncbi:hypothetical protein ACEPWN_20625 [Klebsiella variicola]|uniref:hypothetical protein n=1 Tax=Klebsiella variicola TaxID=244366 RepID=UPI00358ED21F